MAQERGFVSRMTQISHAGGTFNVTIDVDASTVHDGKPDFGPLRSLLRPSSLRFQIRKCDIKELAKMAASSTDDAAKKTFQE